MINIALQEFGQSSYREKMPLLLEMEDSSFLAEQWVECRLIYSIGMGQTIQRTNGLHRMFTS